MVVCGFPSRKNLTLGDRAGWTHVLIYYEREKRGKMEASSDFDVLEEFTAQEVYS